MNGTKVRLTLAIAMLGLVVMPLVSAQSTPTNSTVVAQQLISGTVCNVVDLVKYVAGAIAVLALAILGVQFMTVGSNPAAREDLKNKMAFVGVGMLIIIASSYLVQAFLPQAAICM
jgi:hypothetical protein